MSEIIIDAWVHILQAKVEREVLIRELKQKIKQNEDLLSILNKNFPKNSAVRSFHNEKIRKNLKDLKNFLDFVEKNQKDSFFYIRLSKIALSV